MIITALLLLNFLLMITLPILLARWIQQRYRPGWAFWGMGAATFVLSQVGHIPFNLVVQQLGWLPGDVDAWGNLVITAVFLGLSAGIFEESARYLTYRFWAKDARVWKKGLMLGAGHGGIEAILVGLLGLVNFGVLLAIRNGTLLDVIPAEQLPLVEQQIEAMFGLPWYMTLLGAVERIFAISFHLSASLLVMQVFVRGQLRWLWAAIGWHTLINALAVITVTRWGAVAAEVSTGLIAVLSIVIILRLRDGDEPVEEEEEVEGETAVFHPPQPTISTEKLDETRYS